MTPDAALNKIVGSNPRARQGPIGLPDSDDREKLEFRASTVTVPKRASPLMISSAKPSTSGIWAASPVSLRKRRTATIG